MRCTSPRCHWHHAAEELFPELVYDEQTPYQLIPVLINAIKDLKAEKDAEVAEMAALSGTA